MLQSMPLAPRVRAPRFDVASELFVSSKTIGTALSYNLATENISKSGMLLSWSHSTPVPFAENTILEMTIDPDSNVLDKPVTCLGKVVRRMHKNDAGEKNIQFGIRIVQIDHTDLDNWELCIDDLSLKTSDFVSDKAAMIEEESEVDEQSKKKFRHVA